MNSFISTFEKGLNLDVNPRLINSGYYTDGSNIFNSPIGSIGSVKPIRNSLITSEIIDSSDYSPEVLSNELMNIMGSFEVMCETSSGLSPAIITFISRVKPGEDLEDPTLFYLEAYIQLIPNGSSHTLIYREEIDDINILTKTVDGQHFVEGGISYFYFTDQVGQIKRIKCTNNEGVFSINDVKLSGDYSPYIIDNASIQVNSSGGNLRTGNYIIFTRLYNSTSRKYTKWSLPSIPINIWEDSAIGFQGGSIDANTGRSITFYLSTSSRLTDYDQVQLAVLKTVDGSSTPNLTVDILEPKTPEIDGSDLYVLYTGLEKTTTTTVDDIVTPDAPIKTSETIAIKNNVLFPANISYYPLEYDNGYPEIDDTTTIGISKRSTSEAATVKLSLVDGIVPRQNNEFHYGDEVYRYAVIYHNGDGYFGEPKTIDFSSVTDNRASVGVVDFKFPHRYEEDYAIIDGDNRIQNLYLQIKGLKNHPSWAKGFAILRAERVKDIQFQAALIPSIIVEPSLAYGEYPQTGDPAYADAQPPNPLGTFVPKDLSQMVAKHISRTDPGTGSISDFSYYHYSKGTVVPKESQIRAAKKIWNVFNPSDIYQFNGQAISPYSHRSSDYIEMVNLALMDKYIGILDDDPNDYFSGSHNAYGEYKDSAIYRSYYALNSDYYYYNVGHSKSRLTDLGFIEQPRILEYSVIDSNQDKYVITTPIDGIKNFTFGDHDALQPTGFTEGYKPLNSRMGIAVLSEPQDDVSYYCFDADTGVVTDDISFNAGQIDASLIDEGTINSDVFGDENSMTVVPIANIKRGLDDNRYGDINDYHEFVFTGAYYELTDEEVEDNTPIDIDVYGGDCIASVHTFKVNCSTYSVPEQGEASGDPTRWGITFDDGSGDEVNRPIPIRSHAQTITLVLEADVDGRLVSRTNHLDFADSGSTAIQIPSSPADAYTPYDYLFNLSYNISNNVRVFTPFPKGVDRVNEYKSRIHYSDVKIYNSIDDGFSRIRAGNYYDMDESSGGITKLQLSSGNLFAFQKNAISYLPINSSIIETSDASALAIRSQEVIGNPSYISTIHGSSLIRTIRDSSEGIFAVDRDNSCLILVGKNGIQKLSDIGVESYLRPMLTNSFDIDHRFFGVYDYTNKSYILMRERDVVSSSAEYFGLIYNLRNNQWTSKLTISTDADLFSGVSTRYGLYLIGRFAGAEINSYKFNDGGNSDTFLGSTSSPYIKFSVNASNPIPKVYDTFLIDSSGDIGSVSIQSNGLLASGIDIGSINIEGLRRVPITRSSGVGQRIRGPFAEVTVTWDEDSLDELYSVITNYRMSENIGVKNEQR